MKSRWKKGSALLQTLVMSVLLSMIAISMMKWVLARYSMSGRNYRSALASSRAGGYSHQLFSSWNFVGPGSVSGSMTSPDQDALVISYSASAVGPGGFRTVTVTTADQ